MVTVLGNHLSKTASLPSPQLVLKYCNLPLQSSHLSIKVSQNWPVGGCLRQVSLYKVRAPNFGWYPIFVHSLHTNHRGSMHKPSSWVIASIFVGTACSCGRTVVKSNDVIRLQACERAKESIVCYLVKFRFVSFPR